MVRILRELGRIIGALAVVAGAAAGILAALDTVPGALAGEPRGVVKVARVEDAERHLGARLLVPAFFPDSLRWPPAAVSYVFGPPATALLSFDARAGGTALLLAQSVPAATPLSEELWPPANVMSTTSTTVDGGRLAVDRVLDADGRFWSQTSFVARGRRVALRSAGPAAELARMALSLEHAP